MTVHTDLVSAFGTDLAAAGVVTEAAAVYSGRRPQRVRRTDLEVWVELVERAEEGTGLQRVTRHGYLLHLRGAPTNAGSGGTGDAQQRVVEAAAETIVARYHGALPSALGGALSGTLSACSAQIEDVDEEPDDDERASLAVRVDLWEAA